MAGPSFGVTPKLPAMLTGTSPIRVTKSGLSYNISFEGAITPMSLTQTTVTLAPNTATTIADANNSRKWIGWQNIGLNPATVAPGASVLIGSGFNVDPSSSSNTQGGSFVFPGPGVPTDQFTAISEMGTIIAIWEGE
jgi:hypothetical protein